MNNQTLQAERYVMPFGKFKGMKLIDIVKIVTVDKNGDEKQTGLIYLEWLTKQEWFKNNNIVQHVIDACTQQAEKNEPKPKKKEKKVKITQVEEEDNKVLNFEN